MNIKNIANLSYLLIGDFEKAINAVYNAKSKFIISLMSIIVYLKDFTRY